jgi:hypothetical protein
VPGVVELIHPVTTTRPDHVVMGIKTHAYKQITQYMLQ